MADQVKLPELPSEAEIERKSVEGVKAEQQITPAKHASLLPPLPEDKAAEPPAPEPTPEPKPEPKPQPKVVVTPMPKPEKPVIKNTPVEAPKVVVETKPQKIVVEDKRGGIGCSCRSLSCGGCLLALILIIGVVLILVTRPPAIVDPAKQWLNAGLEKAEGKGMTPAAALAALGVQASTFKVGDNNLVITEDQMIAILKSKLTTTQSVNLQVLPGRVKIYLDGDAGTNVPLWIVGEIAAEDGQNLKLVKLGTERISLPAFLNDFLTRVVFSFANLLGQTKVDSGNLLSAILPLPQNITLKSIKLDEDVMTIVLHMSSGLENLFTE